LNQQLCFDGLAEEFIARKDWVFTWGFGIAYNYQLGKQMFVPAKGLYTRAQKIDNLRLPSRNVIKLNFSVSKIL